MTIDDLVTKLSTDLAPRAWEAAQQVAVINSFSTYETCAMFLLSAGGLAWVGRWLCQKASADADSYDSELKAFFGCIAIGLAGLIALITISCALDPWAWMGFVRPDIAIAHDIMQAAARK